MRSRLTFTVLLAAALLLVGVANGRAAPSTEALNQRVEELVRWIARHSDYPAILRRLPEFRFLAAEAIRHSFGGTQMGYSEKKDVMAAQIKGTIILPDSFALGRDDYMLLHELVHYLQEETGKAFACPKERELEAYRLQSAFVDETGIGHAPNDIFMMMLRCDVRE
jgi:hypothetical protein